MEEIQTNDLNEIVDGLLSGMALARVPERLHPQLLIPVSAAKNEAIVSGDTQTVKKIQKLMRQLNLNPNRKYSDIIPTESRSVSSRQSARSVVGEKSEKTEYDRIVDDLLDGFPTDAVECDDYRQLILALKSRKKLLLSNNDYHSSQLLEDLIQTFNSRMYEDVFEKTRNDQITQFNLQKMQAESDLEGAHRFWDEEKAQYDFQRAAALSELQEQQQRQLDEFDNSFPEILPANFRKLSSRVLNLREQEKHLVLTKRYEEAIEYRRRADLLEKEELRQQREKFQIAFEQQRQQLIATQQAQIRCFNANWDRKLSRLDNERNNEERILKRTVLLTQRKISKFENERVLEPAFPTRPISAMTASPRTASSLRTPSEISPRVRSVASTKLTKSRLHVKKVHRNR